MSRQILCGQIGQWLCGSLAPMLGHAVRDKCLIHGLGCRSWRDSGSMLRHPNKGSGRGHGKTEGKSRAKPKAAKLEEREYSIMPERIFSRRFFFRETSERQPLGQLRLELCGWPTGRQTLKHAAQRLELLADAMAVSALCEMSLYLPGSRSI